MTEALCRWGAIDVGTNSVLLTVAESPSEGIFRVVSQRSTVTRLGQGVDKTGRLHPEAESRTLSCLQNYKKEMLDLKVKKARAVGTSALRDAEGSESFLKRANDCLGFELEVISGDSEARLTFDGALMGLDLPTSAFVFDIGGGSTELIFGNAVSGEIKSAASLNIGSVRLTEGHLLSDPPTVQELEALRQTIRQTLSTAAFPKPGEARAIGVAGTVTSLVAISEALEEYDPELVHGFNLSLERIDALVVLLSGMPLAERLKLPGLTPGRADVIIAGAMLCQEILRHLGEASVLVSDRGVRFGLLKSIALAQTGK